MAMFQTIDNTNRLLSTTKLMDREMFNTNQIKYMKEMIEEMQLREINMNLIIKKMHMMNRRLESELNSLKALDTPSAIVVHQEALVIVVEEK